MWRLFVCSFLGVFAATVCLADSGNVRGTVLDAESRTPIAEAWVEIVVSGAAVTTDTEGRFDLGVPPGPHRVQILCPGYLTRLVTLGTSTTEILLQREKDPLFQESIVVRAPAAGPGDGLRLDDSLSAEAIERQPDASAADVLQRIAGAIVERDRGEADRILIRGAESRLVSTSLDGERLGSPEGDARSAGIGLIPAGLLEAVQVSKTLTPDMDGDAIGGVVNLITRKAPVGGVRTADLSSGWDSEAQDQLGAGSFTFGRRLTDDRLGVLLSASFEDADRGADQLEARYAGDAVERVELRDYELTRQRQGLAAALDYSPTEATNLIAKGFFSALATDELRRRAKFDLGNGEIERELKDSHLEREIASATLGGDHLFNGGIQLDYKIGAQRARRDEPDRIDTSFIQQDVQFLSAGLVPAPSNEDVSRFRLDKIGVENNATQEVNLFAALNLRAPIEVGRSALGLFRAGLKLRDKSKTQDTNTTILETDEDLFLVSFLDTELAQAGFLRGRYDFGPAVGQGRARSLIGHPDLQGRLSLEEEASDYRAGETTSAAYAMVELAVGERLLLLPGVRYERTISDYSGFEVDVADSPQESLVRELNGEQSYDAWLPGVHATWSVTNDFVLRGSLTRSLARPDYFDLVPYRIFDLEDAEIALGNAELRSTKAWNLDLGLEWRPSSSTEMTLALFHKKMSDFIYTRRDTAEISNELFDVTRPTNGHHATLQGLEISLRHRFGAGSSHREGFALEFHYTGTKSAAEVDEFESTSFRLPGQASSSGQLLLSYDRGQAFGNLSLSYVGEYLLELGGERKEDVHFDNQLRLDLATGYSPTDWARISLHVNNLTDEPMRMYQGSPDRLFRLEYTGWSARLGLKLRF